MKLFDIVDYKPVATDECMALPEVQELFKLRYNYDEGDKDGRKRLRGHKELIYIYFLADYRSEFNNYQEDRRHAEALKAAGLPHDHHLSKELSNAIEVLKDHINNSRKLNLLKAARKTVDGLYKYFEHIDISLQDGDSLETMEKKTILAGKVMDNLDKVPKVIRNLETIEETVRRDQGSITKVKGDAERGRL